GDVSTTVYEQAMPLSNDGTLGLTTDAWTHMDVIDISGRCVLRRSLASNTVRTPWADLPSGTYLVCLQGNGRALTRRVLVP
ncbi:MAG TPA: T9SS type A sorting domain-containing protein, partial [Flavobacteriales bacterium]|nr:T9SS type A sorting domain-containing protein [Flavobacteriales bacterium]